MDEKMKPIYESTIASMSPFEKFGIWMAPETLRERVKSQWSATAVVTALLATINFSVLLSLPTLLQVFTTPKWIGIFFTVLTFFSGWGCIFSTIIIATSWSALEATPIESTREFFEEFGWIVNIPNLLLTLASIFIGFAFILFIGYVIPEAGIVCAVFFFFIGVFIRYFKGKLQNFVDYHSSHVTVEMIAKLKEVQVNGSSQEA